MASLEAPQSLEHAASDWKQNTERLTDQGKLFHYINLLRRYPSGRGSDELYKEAAELIKNANCPNLYQSLVTEPPPRKVPLGTPTALIALMDSRQDLAVNRQLPLSLVPTLQRDLHRWATTATQRVADERVALEQEVSTQKDLLNTDGQLSATLRLAMFHITRMNLGHALSTLREAKLISKSKGGAIDATVDILTLNLLFLTPDVLALEEGVILQRLKDITSDDQQLNYAKNAGIGLIYLVQGDYYTATSYLTRGPFIDCQPLPLLTSAATLLTITTLCAASTLSTDAFKAFVQRKDVKARLEDAPVIRDISQAFLSHQFKRVFELATPLVRRLHLDPVCSRFLNPIVSRLLDYCLAAHTKAFSRVSFTALCDVFGLTPSEVDDRLANLVSNGTLEGRIDSSEGLFLGITSSARASTIEKTNEAAREVLSLAPVSIFTASVKQCSSVPAPVYSILATTYRPDTADISFKLSGKEGHNATPAGNSSAMSDASGAISGGRGGEDIRQSRFLIGDDRLPETTHPGRRKRQ